MEMDFLLRSVSFMELKLQMSYSVLATTNDGDPQQSKLSEERMHRL